MGINRIVAKFFKTLAEKAYILNGGAYDDSLRLAKNWTLDTSTKYSNEDTLSNIESSLEDNIMPDLTGINLDDALYLLENKGFNVKFNGYGLITGQSIAAGETLQEKNSINLTLR